MVRLAVLAMVVGCQAHVQTASTLHGSTSDGLTAHERRALAVGVAGTGVLAVAVGVVEGLDALSNRDAARTLGCTNDLSACPPGALSTADQAYALGNLSTGLLIGGAALIGTGITLWVTTHDDDARPTSAWRVTPGIGGVSMARGF